MEPQSDMKPRACFAKARIGLGDKIMLKSLILWQFLFVQVIPPERKIL